MITKIEIQFMEAVKGLYRLLRENAGRGVDWEQRRYEIAKEIYPRVLDFTRADQMTAAAKTTVFLADVLIAELKKGENNVDINIFRSMYNVHVDTLISYDTKGEEYPFLQRYDD